MAGYHLTDEQWIESWNKIGSPHKFAKEHGCTYSIDFDEGYTVTFSSKNINYLEEVSDQLSFLEQTSITE